MDYSQHISKYVCYGNSDGGFCFGKIKGIIHVNTPNGIRDAFILTDRTTCMGKPYTRNNIRHHLKDTLLLVEKILLDRDIINKDEMFEDLTDDELFLLIMQGEVDLQRLGGKGLGIKNLCESSVCDSSVVRDALDSRLK